VTDRDTRRAILEAIRADVRSRVEHIMDRFVRDAYEAVPRNAGAGVLEEALADVSGVLSEGIVAQRRETAGQRPGQGTQ
jgi:hypothetical protein